MTFEEAKELVLWMKKENVQQFEYGELKVNFNGIAFAENISKLEKKIAKVNGADTKKLTPEQETEAILFAST